MSRIKKTILIVTSTIFLILIAGYFTYVKPQLRILNGYAAKKACSCHFIAERDVSSIKAQDLGNPPLNLAEIQIDTASRTASSSVFGMAARTALYRDGLGCTLLNQTKLSPINQTSTPPAVNDTLPWPYGSLEAPKKKTGFSESKLQEAIAYAFDDEGEYLKKTRAVLVLKGDSIIAEQYADGFDQNTEILGWSMTKSICNILIGILVRDGKIDVDEDKLFEEWTDERKQITLDNLLRMNSGLKWDEVYDEIADATQMLFTEDNMPSYVLSNKLESPPGEVFEYSSGTSNLLSALIRNTINNDELYNTFHRSRLFDILGIENAVIEADPSGHFVMSSYCYATPREWAKLGLLYKNKGVWGRDTIFTEEWYNYSLKPTEASPNGSYGAHIWLNTNNNEIKDGPEDMFKFSGFEGQYVYILPSQDMVIVRMGLSEGPHFEINGLIKLILEATG